MIKVNHIGRLGNNMFQYALGRILAEEMGYSLDAPSIDHFDITKNKIEGETILNNPLTVSGHEIDIEKIKQTKNRQITLNGFFQRYEYYQPYKDKIREWFKLDDLDVGQTDKDAIVHLRMGDCITGFLPKRKPYLMPFEYYESVLSHSNFEKLYICSNPETMNHPVFLSYVEKLNQYNPKLLTGNTIEDLRAIKSFKNIVMSQSTFSWWGAFLSHANTIFFPIPQKGVTANLSNEWSDARPDIDLTVDEGSYKYIIQDSDKWAIQ